METIQSLKLLLAYNQKLTMVPKAGVEPISERPKGVRRMVIWLTKY